MKTITGWSLLKELAVSKNASKIASVEVMWPAIFAVQVALVDLWKSWRIKPNAVIGHSIGEVVAAHAAGILSLEDSVKIICNQSRLVSQTSGKGAMALVEVPYSEIKQWLEENELGAHVAIHTSPKTTVLSGTPDVIREVITKLQSNQVFCRLIKTDVAIHSPQMDFLQEELIQSLQGIQPRKSPIPFISTLTGQIIEGPSCDAKYWFQNLRDTVLFSEAMESVLSLGYENFLEISPHPILLKSISECMSASNKNATSLPSMQRDVGEIERIQESKKILHSLGFPSVGNHGSKIVFVFPGQGSQWLGMGRSLLKEEPVFREAIERCEKAMSAYVDWSLVQELQSDEKNSRLSEIDVVQPTLFAIEVALTALWKSWGVEPDAVVGHSMGEVAAAYVAGALSLEDATKVICERSKLLRRISGQGAMVMVELSQKAAQSQLAGYEDKVSVAVSNSPRSTVLSGDETALKQIFSALEKRKIFCRWVKVDVASHSPQVDCLQDDLLEVLSGLKPNAGNIPIYSTVTNQITDGSVFDAHYWVTNLRSTVRFSESVEHLVNDGHEVFMEMSPHPVLLPAIDQCGKSLKQECTALPSLRRDEEERAILLESLGTLYTLGHHINWHQLYPDGGRLVHLPTYAWQRERYWLEELDTKEEQISTSSAVATGDSNHPLLGTHLQPATQKGHHYWEMEYSTDRLPFLADHQVRGMVIFPTTAFVEMALFAAKEALGKDVCELRNISIEEALVIPADHNVKVQLILSPDGSGTYSFQIMSHHQNDTWVVNASGKIGSDSQSAKAPAPISLKDIQAQCTEIIASSGHYQLMEKKGLEYGPSFQKVEEVWRRDGEALGRLHHNDSEGHSPYQMDPTLVDAGLQVMLAALPKNESADSYLPVACKMLHCFASININQPLYSYVRLHSDLPDQDAYFGDVFIVDKQGQCLAKIEQLHLKRVEASSISEQVDQSLYFKREWIASKQPQMAAQPAQQPGTWLIFSDTHGLGDKIATQLRVKGHSCVQVFPGKEFSETSVDTYSIDPASSADMKRLFKEVFANGRPACAGAVNLWSLESAVEDELNLERLKTDQERGTFSALHLIQSLLNAGWLKVPKLFLVTNGAVDIHERETPLAVSQSPLWGLGRVVHLEHPELQCKRIDLEDQKASSETSERLMSELLADDREEEIAFRNNERFVSRMEPLDILKYRETLTSNVEFHSDASYLITGGLGGLGLKLAEWLIDNGVQHLILTSRRSSDAKVQEILKPLQKDGVQIEYAQADVENQARYAQLFEEIHQTMPPLKGIFHVAGILDDRVLTEQTAEHFQTVMAPKVWGSWNLHELSRDLPLDYFVMFSSVASFLGSPGQGNYAAANAFMDALAQHRRAQGLPALSINWGPWSEVGLAAAQDVRGNRLTSRGLESISPTEAFVALGQLMEVNQPEVAVIHFNHERWGEFYPDAINAPFFTRLRDGKSQQIKTTKQKQVLRESLVPLNQRERCLHLHTYLREKVSQVLRVSADRLDPEMPFESLGLDSLMSLELRNLLEASTELSLESTIFWTYPNIQSLSEYLLDEFELGSGNNDSETQPVEESFSDSDRQTIVKLLRRASQ